MTTDQQAPVILRVRTPLPPGDHLAIVKRVSFRETLELEHKLHAALWLPRLRRHIRILITLPYRFSADAHQQMFSFCAAVGLTPEHLHHAIAAFVGRTLVIRTERTGHDSKTTAFLPTSRPRQITRH